MDNIKYIVIHDVFFFFYGELYRKYLTTLTTLLPLKWKVLIVSRLRKVGSKRVVTTYTDNGVALDRN